MQKNRETVLSLTREYENDACLWLGFEKFYKLQLNVNGFSHNIEINQFKH